MAERDKVSTLGQLWSWFNS